MNFLLAPPTDLASVSLKDNKSGYKAVCSIFSGRQYTIAVFAVENEFVIFE